MTNLMTFEQELKPGRDGITIILILCTPESEAP